MPANYDSKYWEVYRGNIFKRADFLANCSDTTKEGEELAKAIMALLCLDCWKENTSDEFS